MFKAICNLITEGVTYNVGTKYSEKDLKGVPKFIVDQCFVPAEADVVEAKVDTNTDGDIVDNNLLTVKELTEALTTLGVEIPEGSKKADLVALLDKAQA